MITPLQTTSLGHRCALPQAPKGLSDNLAALATLLAVLVALTLSAGCNRSGRRESSSSEAKGTAAAKHSFRVGYSAAGLIDRLQVAWSDAVKESVQAAGGEVLLVDSQNKIAKQIADIEDLLAQNVDLLIVNPVDEAGIGVAILAANRAGVPVITIDRNGGAGQIVAKVGFDNYQAGFDAGEFIAKRNGYKGHVAQIMGMAGGNETRQRADGFRDAIAKYPAMKIVFQQHGDWDTSKAQALTDDLLTSHPDVVGIWAHADSMVMGAVRALKMAGKRDQVVTVGMGMFGGAPAAIKAGDLTASWYLHPEQLGKAAGEAAAKIHRGEKVEPMIRTPMTFVTKENVDQFLK
jgi:ribose transport system substrate-binding protein